MNPFAKKHAPFGVAVVLLAIHFASFDIRTLPVVTDIRFYLYFAWRVTEGAVPHLEFFDNKTQLATYAGAVFYKIGDWLGADPLLSIRAGYLAIAAAGGLLAFSIHRKLAGNQPFAGLLGVLAYCSFGLLGLLPAVGNVPKLLMAVCASAMAWMVGTRRWFLAGVFGSLAFMDWQIGALVWVAAFTSAFLFANRRARASMHVFAGGVAGVLPFFLVYTVSGALGEAFRQVVGSSLFRGASSMASGGLSERLDSIGQMVRVACPEQGWLFYTSGVGVAVALWWLWRPAHPDQRIWLFPLAVYHFGILGFSLIDFQWFGDFFALLHTAAFFLGLSWVALYRLFDSQVARRQTPRAARLAIATIALLIATGLARPSILRPKLTLSTATTAADVVLADQQQVADRLKTQLVGRRSVVLGPSELLFLMRTRQPLPVIYWNQATWYRYRYENEDMPATQRRLVSSVAPEALILDRSTRSVQVTSDNRHYRVFVMELP